MRVTLVVQARTGSKRFPGKVLKKISNIPLVLLVLKRLSFSKEVDEIVLATSKKKKDDILANLLKKKNFLFFRGSEKNVLSRFYKIGKKFNSDYIVRVTADCPFINYKIVDQIVKIAKKNKYSYLSNIEPRSYPKGLDVEVIKFSLLQKVFLNSKNPNILEHVTYSIRRSKTIKRYNLNYYKDLSKFNICIDYKNDLKKVKNIYKEYGIYNFSLKKLENILKRKYE